MFVWIDRERDYAAVLCGEEREGNRGGRSGRDMGMWRGIGKRKEGVFNGEGH